MTTAYPCHELEGVLFVENENDEVSNVQGSYWYSSSQKAKNNDERREMTVYSSDWKSLGSDEQVFITVDKAWQEFWQQYCNDIAAFQNKLVGANLHNIDNVCLK